MTVSFSHLTEYFENTLI